MHFSMLVTIGLMMMGQTSEEPVQAVVPYTGSMPRLTDPAPSQWGLGGLPMIRVETTVSGLTPIMRTLVWDARTVEILSSMGPVRPEHVQLVIDGGQTYIRVGRFLLVDVTDADAATAGVSVAVLARQWVAHVRRVLPQVAPLRRVRVPQSRSTGTEARMRARERIAWTSKKT